MSKRLLYLILVLLLVSPLLFNATTPKPKVHAQDDSTFKVAGLEGSVTVIYDQMGIPHIYADSPHDLFMAQGYIHASHRWWQMEWWRHLSAGRLSEIAGDTTLGNDKFLRTLGYQAAAEKDWEALSEETHAILEAYTEGVNAYLADKAPAELAVEYEFLAMSGNEMTVKPWTVYDSLRWLKVMALSLAGNFQTEIFRSQVIEFMGPLGARVIFPPYPYAQHPVIIEPHGIDYTTEATTYTPSIPENVDFSRVNFNLVGNVDLSDPNITPLGHGMGIGSNSWVISGELTESGHSMVMNDPHLGIQMPSIWYEVGLHCNTKSDECPYDVVGVSFGGVPGIIIGHNDRISWAFTNVGTDVQDLYILTLNPDDPNQYQLDGEWVDFELETQTLNIAGAEPVELTIRHSVWGPVMSDFLPVGDQVLAMRWTAFDANASAEAIFLLNIAQNWEDFRAAASKFDGPAQNMLYADVDGNIGYQMPGLTPLRAKGHDGDVPIDGSLSSNAWQGYVPFEELPSLYNPEEGYIVTANNSVVPEDYPYYITDMWDFGYRGARIETMIQNDEDGVYTIEEMMAIQGDNYDARASFLVPALQALTFDDPALNDAAAWLGEWDYQAHMDSPYAALFNMFWRELLTLAAGDELGFTPDGGDLYAFLISKFLLTDVHPLWDSQETSDVIETRDDILKQAFASAYAQMVELQGDDPNAWAWGQMHMAVFRASPLGSDDADPTLEALFNVSVPASGSSAIVNATGWDANEGFELTSLPSMRQITVVGDWDSSLRVNTLGQSGDPNSSHYKDQVEMWRNIQYHPEWFSRQAVEADAEATWVLEP